MADEVDYVVFKAMLRPYRVALIVLVPAFATVGKYGYEGVSFVERDETHEQRQNERAQTQQAEIDSLQRRHLEALQVFISELDFLRSTIVGLLPAHKRGSARRNFDKQRERSIRLLVEAQSKP